MQCDLEETEGKADPVRPKLRLREHQLFDKNEKAWVAPFGKLARVDFRAGMVHRVFAKLRSILDGWSELFGREPLVDIGTRDAKPADIVDLASRPELARVRRLSLTEGGKSIGALLSSPHITALRDLHLYQAGLDDERLATLLGSELLVRLNTLALSGNRLTQAAVARLVGRDDLRELRCLTLGWLVPDVRPFIQAMRLPALEDLDLLANAINGHDLAALVDGGTLATIRRLRLTQNELEAEAVTPLGQLANLEELDLSTNALGSAGAEALARRPPPKLRMLKIWQGRIGDAGVEALAQGVPTLVELELASNGSGSRAGVAIARADWKLEKVSLWGCSLDDEAAIAIANAPWRATVRELNLRGNDIGDAGAAAIAAAEWPCLEVLRFERNEGIGEAGAKALDAASGMPMLSALDLSETHAPKTRLKTLRKRLGSGLRA